MLAVLDAGFQPMGVVMGAVAVRLFQPSCLYAMSASTEPLLYGYEGALRSAWRTAVGRLDKEASNADARGVVGISVRSNPSAGLSAQAGVRQFQLVGTAARARSGAARVPIPVDAVDGRHAEAAASGMGSLRNRDRRLHGARARMGGDAVAAGPTHAEHGDDGADRRHGVGPEPGGGRSTSIARRHSSRGPHCRGRRGHSCAAVVRWRPRNADRRSSRGHGCRPLSRSRRHPVSCTQSHRSDKVVTDERAPDEAVANLPAEAITRLRQLEGADGKAPLFTSDLSVSEFLLIEDAGFEPLEASSSAARSTTSAFRSSAGPPARSSTS